MIVHWRVVGGFWMRWMLWRIDYSPGFPASLWVLVMWDEGCDRDCCYMMSLYCVCMSVFWCLLMEIAE